MKKLSGFGMSFSRNPIQIVGFGFFCMHIILLVLTVITHAFPIFIWQNVIGLLSISTLTVINRFHPISQMYLIFSAVIVSWIQINISILATGVDAGFQNYFFATLSSAFFLTYSTKSTKVTRITSIIELGSLIMYLFSGLHGQKIVPLYVLTERELFVTSLINSAFVLIIITLFADCYRYKLSLSVINLQQAADLDPLTKLFNRRGIRRYFDMLQLEWEKRGKPYVVAIFDIDDFKDVNDTWGHNTGDRVLIEIARIFMEYTDGVTWACRWGGEEFLIISQITDSKAKTLAVLGALLNDIRRISIPVHGGMIQVTATVGTAFSEHDLMIHELLNKADNALYRGKTSGKNQIVLAE